MLDRVIAGSPTIVAARRDRGMTVPVVTALRARGPGRVAVDLDGEPWRVVPLEAVYAAGLVVGRALDRPTARALGRELRRLEARRRRRCGRCGRATTRRRRSSGGSPSGGRRRRAAGDGRGGASAAGSSTTGGSRMQRAAQLAGARRGRSADRRRPRASGGSARARRELRSAALEPEAVRAAEIIARAGPKPANGPIPGLARDSPRRRWSRSLQIWPPTR